MTLRDIMKDRRSVRRFSARAPDREVVETLIEAATLAPSAMNKQPWRFLAVTNPATVEEMARLVEERSASLARHVDEDFKASFVAYSESFLVFRRAPVVIVALYKDLAFLSEMVEGELAREERASLEQMERASGLVSVSMALQNLLLAAHDAGLGALCLTGPLLAVDGLRELLAVQPSWLMAAVVAVGYPDEAPGAPGRKAVARVLKWID